jgi:hypothetical protein
VVRRQSFVTAASPADAVESIAVSSASQVSTAAWMRSALDAADRTSRPLGSATSATRRMRAVSLTSVPASTHAVTTMSPVRWREAVTAEVFELLVTSA